jgi:hypothetical protein
MPEQAARNPAAKPRKAPIQRCLERDGGEKTACDIRDMADLLDDEIQRRHQATMSVPILSTNS